MSLRSREQFLLMCRGPRNANAGVATGRESDISWTLHGRMLTMDAAVHSIRRRLACGLQGPLLLVGLAALTPSALAISGVFDGSRTTESIFRTIARVMRWKTG